MALASDLRSKAHAFASSLKSLLNRTICDEAHVSAVVVPKDHSRVIVGTDLDLATFLARPVPATTGRKKAKVWITAGYRCFLDPDGYLTVDSSRYAVSADAAGDVGLCYYDFEREKDRYATAHLQVEGESAALGALPGPRGTKDLHKLHFPVGGRRYRPCLEDVIEFMVTEGFADGRPDWEQVLNDERDKFLANQLKAAVRRHPETAKAVLRAHKLL